MSLQAESLGFFVEPPLLGKPPEITITPSFKVTSLSLVFLVIITKSPIFKSCLSVSLYLSTSISTITFLV